MSPQPCSTYEQGRIYLLHARTAGSAASRLKLKGEVRRQVAVREQHHFTDSCYPQRYPEPTIASINWPLSI